MSKPEPVLVLGARSLVGRFLLPQLAAQETAVTAVSRAPSVGEGAPRWVPADLTRPETLAGVSASRVFSLSPIWLLPGALPALLANGMQRLVAFSSTSRFTKSGSSSAEERRVAERLAEGEADTLAFCSAAAVLA